MENNTVKPLISFVLPTKDREEWVGECIVSLLGQTEKNIEVVVINDGSKDGTKEFLEEWLKDNARVKLIHHEESIGAGPSRNEGMEKASADIIAVCDDDDIYLQDKAENVLKHFKEHPESELVNFPYVSIGYCNELVEQYRGEPFNYEAFKKEEKVYFCNPSVAYKKSAVMAMGGYPKEDGEETDDHKFLKKWVEAGHKVDFSTEGWGVLHRVLPTSMMAKLRGFNPAWVTPPKKKK